MFVMMNNNFQATVNYYAALVKVIFIEL